MQLNLDCLIERPEQVNGACTPRKNENVLFHGYRCLGVEVAQRAAECKGGKRFSDERNVSPGGCNSQEPQAKGGGGGRRPRTVLSQARGRGGPGA